LLNKKYTLSVLSTDQITAASSITGPITERKNMLSILIYYIENTSIDIGDSKGTCCHREVSDDRQTLATISAQIDFARNDFQNFDAHNSLVFT
jgi:hypothetical protein